MIAFATLFLGLVVGVQPLAVVAGDEVAAVEIRLNARKVATLRGEPWSTSFDFGSELAPQVLEAVAFDASNREVGRARQVINLPHPPAVASLVVDTDPQRGTSVARLSWESRVGDRPRSIRAWLDGAPLTFEDPRHIVLPPHDPSRLHLFSAELEFGDHVSSQVMATFGGTFADQVRTELTAIPVLVASKKAKPPSAGAMRGWFLKNGEPLDVVAVEKGRSEIVVVLAAQPAPSGSAKEFRSAVPLRNRQTLRLLDPSVQQSPGVGTTFNLFEISPEYDSGFGGLYWLLTQMRYRGVSGDVRLADAVAVAGLAAYERSLRRAVILLVAGDTDDASLISARQSRRYLERLRVPLHLWTTEKRADVIEGWGEPVSVATLRELGTAFDRLNKEMHRQWIVWFDGRHLPQEIALSSEARGLELPGGNPR